MRTKKIEELSDLIKVQRQNLSDEYMRGMCNGLICALAVLTDTEPQYVEPPIDSATKEAAPLSAPKQNHE